MRLHSRIVTWWKGLWCKYWRQGWQGLSAGPGSCGEHCIPDGRRSLVFDAQGTKRELVLADAAEQFDAGDRRGRAIIVLEAEHGPGPEFDPAMILLDQVVQIFRGSQFALLPCSIFIGHFTHGAMRRGIAIQSNADRSASLGAKRFTEERLGGGHIPHRAQPEIDGAAILVYRTI